MRALHIDAFFEYLMNKPHAYYEEVPPLHAPFPEHGRDGVPLEEDLAIRALDPKYRPKRGRRKADEEDGAAEATPTPSKRPHLDTPTAFLNQSHPMSAYPSSAYPSSAHPDHGMRDPWAAVDTVAGAHSNSDSRRAFVSQSAHPSSVGQQLHWRLNNSFTPSTPQPFSAIIPGPGQTAHTAFDEPRSAISPSSSRAKRRRHGPAVSSAWSGGSNTSGGKPRGRPPSNRSTQDGPFGTFPANPASREGSMQAIPRSTPDPPPNRERAQSESGMEQPSPHFRLPPSNYPASAVATVPPQSFPVPPSRRGRLSLQVPQHVGGPVHLVTPTLLVNGETDPAVPPTLAPSVFSSSSRRSSSHVPEDSDAGGSDTFPVPQARQAQSEQHPQSTVRRPDREDLKRALAAELLRARITGRKRLRGAEAKALADAMLRRMKPDTGSSSGNEMSKDIFPPMCASWLGLNLTENGCSAPNGSNAKTITVQRFRVGKDGYDSPIYDDEEEGETSGVVKETFEVEWSAALGGVTGRFVVQGLVIPKEDGETGEDVGGEGEVVDGSGGGASDAGVDWKKKFLALQERLRERDREVQSIRDRVLDAVL
ncbi:hypothetical protein H2201_004452 [Coniosporium apollinis]|uniref:Uncharacterized protein n=1 Tax=Coniosporium apollinis TaxID=61459 RepID=A0ABQ9NSK5_9PEZI|nr:hypothetical protein H2201_004452 [Coniosporium apollinis]